MRCIRHSRHMRRMPSPGRLRFELPRRHRPTPGRCNASPHGAGSWRTGRGGRSTNETNESKSCAPAAPAATCLQVQGVPDTEQILALAGTTRYDSVRHSEFFLDKQCVQQAESHERVSLSLHHLCTVPSSLQGALENTQHPLTSISCQDAGVNQYSETPCARNAAQRLLFHTNRGSTVDLGFHSQLAPANALQLCFQKETRCRLTCP